jgi:hypothetical protein
MKHEKNTMKRNLFGLLFLIAIYANSEPPENLLILQYGDYCHFFKIDETAFRLEWGKNNIRNISVLIFGASDILKCHLVTETDEFTVLKIDNDTGIKKSIILPLTSKSQEIQYQNAVCVDLENKTILLEHPSHDSILTVENFITKKNMILGKDLIPCQSGFAHDCLDSLVFYDNKLIFKWITPDKHHSDKKVELKKFKIKLR